MELRAAVLEKRGPAGAFVLTDEQVAVLGGGARAFPVSVTIGDVTLALRVARMGGESLVGLSRAAREEAGVEIGASYDVTLVADTAERTVEVPDDLAAALTAAGVREAYDALAPSRRKEVVRRVTEAKRAETRAARVAAAVAELSG